MYKHTIQTYHSWFDTSKFFHSQTLLISPKNYPTQQKNYILNEALVTALFQIEIAIILVIISSNHGKWQKIFGIRNKFNTESFQGHQTKTKKSLIL